MANEENLIPFKKGQSGNPKGRPKSSWKKLNEDMILEGNEPLTRKEYLRYFRTIASMTEQQMLEVAQDKSQPYAIRFLIMELNNKKTRSKFFLEMMNVAFNQEGKETVVYNVDVSLEEAKKLAQEIEDEI